MKANSIVKILLVDDRPENLFALEVIFSSENYLCVKANSGSEALKILRHEQGFAIILMDVQMPKLDGFKTVELIRKIEKLKHIPIIFLTASMDTSVLIFKGYNAGAVDYMIKPLSPEILKAKVAVFVALYNKTHELLVQKEQMKTINSEKEKRAAELIIANKELAFQNEEKEKRAAELIIANKELAFQNEEKEKRAEELIIAYRELVFQNEEKEKRAAELIIVNKELAFQNEEKEKRAEELKLLEEVQLLNKKKDEFIALASHELKTPVTTISAYLQFLQRNLVNDEKNKQLAAKALQQVQRLESLIADLLDVSKIVSGKLPLSFSTFDILDLLKEVIEMVQHGGITHKIKTNCDFNQLPVNADKQRIEQVLINLISNAIKYSPNADRVIISVSQTENDAIMSLQDFGIGIKKDQHARIFSRFYRVEDMAPHMSGLGLGLYICHEIISRHNGELSVESKFGKGSTFQFKIPKGLQAYVVPLN